LVEHANWEEELKATREAKAYIVGGGVAGLAAAVYFITDAGLPANRIVFFEEGGVLGGSLDASGSPKEGYLMRGGRMFEEHYVCTYDLLSKIPSFDDPHVSASDDIRNFTQSAGWNSRARLIDRNGEIVDVSSMGFDWADRIALARLLLASEAALGDESIEDVFPKHFLTSNFWLMWCTMFSFQPWHSAVEMRRYLLRFIHLFPSIADLSCVWHTRYNQYHSMVEPLRRWLDDQGVKFQQGARVLDMDLEDAADGFRVARLKTRDVNSGAEQEIALGGSDLVVFTNGSMTDASTYGSMTAPAGLNDASLGGSWALWKRLAEKRKGLGCPDVFIRDIAKSKWLSFTVTMSTPLFRNLIGELTHRPYGREGLITFKDSSWFMTIHPYFNPAYPGQSPDQDIWWGYGLNPDAVGDFVKKRMSDCAGEELLRETFAHLRLERRMDELIAQSTARSCMMPYITSQFMPRMKGDRPDVLPAGSQNLAFVGQFAEAPDDVVFTVEYSVRTARMAVKALLGLDTAIPPVYKGQHDLFVLIDALRESLS
jgi:oleate hydratase